jgi:hypothetical protein
LILILYLKKSRFLESGFQDGLKHGRIAGLEEGFELGLNHSFALASQIGYYEGVSLSLLSYVNSLASSSSSSTTTAHHQDVNDHVHKDSESSNLDNAHDMLSNSTIITVTDKGKDTTDTTSRLPRIKDVQKCIKALQKCLDLAQQFPLQNIINPSFTPTKNTTSNTNTGAITPTNTNANTTADTNTSSNTDINTNINTSTPATNDGDPPDLVLLLQKLKLAFRLALSHLSLPPTEFNPTTPLSKISLQQHDQTDSTAGKTVKTSGVSLSF